MSSEQRHRGKHPADEELFGGGAIHVLQSATADLCWMLSRGYARTSALKLVGDRHLLTERQRIAVGRAACSEEKRERRARNRRPSGELNGLSVAVDGFNLLISLEAALSGGVLLFCRDGCIRDMSSVHGSYHAVVETDAALAAVGARFAELGVVSTRWLLDRPVSNSGRLAERIREIGVERGWPWTAEAINNPDAALIAAPEIVISSDGRVIDGAAAWFNLAADLLLDKPCCKPWLVDLQQ